MNTYHLGLRKYYVSKQEISNLTQNVFVRLFVLPFILVQITTFGPLPVTLVFKGVTPYKTHQFWFWYYDSLSYKNKYQNGEKNESLIYLLANSCGSFQTYFLAWSLLLRDFQKQQYCLKKVYRLYSKTIFLQAPESHIY